MARTANHEPLVPLSELGLSGMSLEDARAYGSVTGVDVVVDYLDRPSVRLDDAYKLAEQRRKADREYREAEVRKRTEHARAVADLQARMNRAFTQARNEAQERLAKLPHFGGMTEIRGEASNEGLNAARMLWAAAPELVRQEVTRVTALEDDTLMTYELGMSLPKPILDHYVRTAARKA